MTTTATSGGSTATLPDRPSGLHPVNSPRPERWERPRASTGIVVGVDGSDASVTALHWALAEGAVRGVPVEVVYAWEYPPVSGYPVAPMGGDYDAGKAADTALEDIMTGVADLLRNRPSSSPVDSQAIQGRASAILIGEAAAAQLLVVGTRGRGGFAGLLLGSVSQQCTAHAFCPVVVVHETVAN